MTADWDEVKRLAADFQRAQLSSTVQRLSERNCIELITRLIEDKLLDVVFTTDGKEYVTPQQLSREIEDELYVHGGRVDIVELSKILNVDLSHISAQVIQIENQNKNVKLVLGQLLGKSYINRVIQEINEKLMLQGQITVSELTRQYDLPPEFLLSLIEENLGKSIHGKQDATDRQVFFTDAFLHRNKACLRGALMAATCPTSVAHLLSQSGVQQRIFSCIIDSLLERKQVPGVITGSQSGNSLYIPSVYSKAQNDWINNFYRQNGYLEYDSLGRLGIGDPTSFIQRNFQNEKLLLLKSCAVGEQLVNQVEAALEEAIATSSFVDVMTHLPSMFEAEDCTRIVNEVLKSMKTKNPVQNVNVFCDTYVVPDLLIQNLIKGFDPLIKQKAQEAVSSGAYISSQAEMKIHSSKMSVDHEDSKIDKKEERRKKATGGKGGGGTQGRETKTKSTKKKYLRGKGGADDWDSDDDRDSSAASGNKTSKQSAGKLELLSFSVIHNLLAGNKVFQNEECEELVEEIAKQIYPALNKIALAEAKVVFESTMASTAQTRRKTHSELQEKLNALVSNVRMFDKGIKVFSDNELQQQLSKYLLKSLCTDIANDVFSYIAQENMIQFDQSKEMTPEMRLKMINEVPNDAKEPLSKLHKSLSGSSIDNFLSSLEASIGPGLCDMILRKQDKRKERPQIYAHRQSLLEQLSVVQDPAVVLHIASLILFQTLTQSILHASGRFVSNILSFLQPQLPAEMYNSFQQYHDMVLKLLKTDENDPDHVALITLLQNGMSGIKEMASTFKRPSTSEKS
ncbi:hypothetical protein R5R35_001007 [Gryllus longicercus]|uniref:E3 UFM1-protein ligase 1 homolog n=1 Tax=Gryllus longicercus TaxID=2509291 RepID=A0AAN9VWX9_9ORTH